VIPEQATLVLGEIQIRALVAEVRHITEHTKAMCIARWNPELTMIFIVQLNAYILPTGWRRRINIYRHVKYRPARHADQLALRAGLLKMKTTQDSPLRAGMVVLHERQINSRLAIAFDLERLQKKSAMVPKHPGLDDQHPGKLRFNNLQNVLLRGMTAASHTGPVIGRVSIPP